MRLLYYGDVHWAQNSSILRSNGHKYSTRLENLIASVNWAEEEAIRQHCDTIIIGGDFFDAAQLNSQEISALQEIVWAPLSHVFLTGNHETNVSNLSYSTADLFNLCPNSRVVNNPEQYRLEENMEICFLPYILERDRNKIVDYFGIKSCKRIIFSHNDLKDVNYGNFISPEGFELADINMSCDLFINGHIHHCGNITDKIINGGNLTGQNFTENETYSHCALLVDTDKLSVEFISNPFAIYFNKLDCTDVSTRTELHSRLSALPEMSVVTIKVTEDLAKIARDVIHEFNNKIIEYRLLLERHNISTEGVLTIESVDHIQQFENYVLSHIGDSTIIKEELAILTS